MRKLTLYIFITMMLMFYIVLCFKLSESVRLIKELQHELNVYEKAMTETTKIMDSLELTLKNREYQISLLNQTNELILIQANRVEKELRIYRNKANFYERLAKFQSEPRFTPPLIYFTSFSISPRVNL